jgi:hypothetical protein
MMKRITRFLGAGATGLIVATSAAADCQAELDAMLGSGAGGLDAQDKLGTPPEDVTLETLEPSDGESAEAGTLETGSFEGDLAELQSANEAQLDEMEREDTGKEPQASGLPEENDREAALQEARGALAAGNEAGCMSAIERARGL